MGLSCKQLLRCGAQLSTSWVRIPPSLYAYSVYQVKDLVYFLLVLYKTDLPFLPVLAIMKNEEGEQ